MSTLAQTFNQRVTLQALVAGQDAYGSPSTTWENVVSSGDGALFASVDDLTGREFMNAGGTQNAVTTKIKIRYRPGVVATMRALHGGNIYNIEAVLGQDRHTLLLMCSRGANLG